MSRTRIVFFGVLAVFLVLIGVGLAVEAVNLQTMEQLFIAATIFGVGVVLLDLFGVLGHHGGDGDLAPVSGHAGDMTVGDAGHGDMGHGDMGHADGGDGGHGHAGDDDSGHGNSHHAPQDGHSAGPIISMLTYLRLLVYFCVGFGPVGWVAMSNGRSPLASLLLASAVGAGAVFVAQWFFRLQRKDTDSQIEPGELVARDAIVLVPLDSVNMGRVRVRVGMNVEDRFALAADPGRRYEKGEAVRIARVTDECLYVR